MARRASRKRKRHRPAAGPRPAPPASEPAAPRRSGRSRAKDDAARAALEPLAEGERPTAVTVGAIAAAALAAANLVALVIRFDPDQPNKTAATALGALILGVVAAGMWRARYWAVLGMQTILLIAIVLALVALITASNLAAVLLVLAIVLPSGALFWFLVKAMARIHMPERPGPRPPPM